MVCDYGGVFKKSEPFQIAMNYDRWKPGLRVYNITALIALTQYNGWVRTQLRSCTHGTGTCELCFNLYLGNSRLEPLKQDNNFKQI